MSRRAVPLSEVARTLDIAWRTARERVKDGTIPSRDGPLGREILRADFEAWLNKSVETSEVAGPDAPCVYFVRAGRGPIKIGLSTKLNFRMRLGALQIAHHEPLKVLGLFAGTRALEQKIHRALAKHRVRGEWFHPVPEVINAMKSLRKLVTDP